VVNWRRFTPSNFEYDFERDKLSEHAVTFEEAVECFFSDFEIRRNKRFRDRYQLMGKTLGGRRLKVISTEIQQRGSHYYRLALMNAAKKKKNPPLSQEDTDRLVASRSEDDSAWEAPVRVKRSEPASLSIPGDLAARAAFLARLHRETGLDKWVERIVRERVELEELAFSEAKKELAS
jgi:uncharacterized DUF497 family protein